MQHTFLYISLPLFRTTTTWNFQKLSTYTFYEGNVVCGPVQFFFAPAHFYLGGRWHFSFSHSRYKIFTLFSKRNWSSLFFLSLALALPLLSTPMQTLKLSRKKESASFFLSFISKSPDGYAIYYRNAPVLEKQNFTPAYMKGWTYVRTYSVRTIFSEPKFRGCIVYQIFLPVVLRCARFARESSAINI